MSRFLENLFKHWPKLLLPIVLVAILAALIGRLQSDQYSTSALIWTDTPTFLPPSDNSSSPSSSDNTPAQLRVSQFSQLILSQSFLDTVVAQVKMTDPKLPDDWNPQGLAKSFKVTAVGNNLISIVSSATDPEVARAQVLGLFQAFRDNYAQDLQAESSSTTGLYQSLLTGAEANQEIADKAVSDYLILNPQLLQNPSAAALDPKLVGLQGTSRSQQEQVQSLLIKIEQIRQQSTFGVQGQNSFFRLQDNPVLPPLQTNKKTSQMILFGILGAVAGLILGVAYVMVMTLLDHTFFRSLELAGLTGVPTYQAAYLKMSPTLRLPITPVKVISENKADPELVGNKEVIYESA